MSATTEQANVKKKILYLINVDWFFISHRLPIALAAIDEGYEVHIASGITSKQEELQSYGIVVHPIPISRSNSRLIGELVTFFAVFKTLKSVKPDVLHMITIKPVLYGGLASRFIGIHNNVAAISGLGFIFTKQGFFAGIRRRIVKAVYFYALQHKKLRIIFQNSSDRDTLSNVLDLRANQIVMIPGSGVDLTEYTFQPPRCGTPIVLMGARLLYDKGVYEFVAAARLLKKKGIDVRFQLAGRPDPENPHSITGEEFGAWKNEGVVEMLGFREDMPELLARSNIFVLPSYYGEGLSKSIIEASASGRPVVTTNTPGCRDAIIPDVTGLLVPERDSLSLANAIEKLVLDENLSLTMGRSGRRLAEQRYSIKSVVETHLNIYSDLLNNKV